MNASPDTRSRILGGLWGSLVGDALGVPVEFQDRAARTTDPVTGMRAYGTHRQPAGTWSDDGALLLCSAESLVEHGFDTDDMGRRFLRWHDDGHWTAHGNVFDIGIATRQALMRIRQGVIAEQAGGQDEFSNGNGSLMRILPVALIALNGDMEGLRTRIHRASAITHGHLRSQMACVYFGFLVRALMKGRSQAEAVKAACSEFTAEYAKCPEMPAFQRILDRGFGTLPPSEIYSDGYVMHTLEAAVWCLLTTDDFSCCVLKAVNLGGDTDTTGCVAGGLAGVLYGLEHIPPEWCGALPQQTDLTGLLGRFEHTCRNGVSAP